MIASRSGVSANNVNKEHTEFGIAPDIFVNMADTPDRDAIIERAKEWIMSGGK